MMDAATATLVPRVATSLGLPPGSVEGCLELLLSGATVPFIARYRKERTGSLDEVAIRAVAETHRSLADLVARRETILRTIAAQGRLTPELKSRIEACWDRAELEDLYLPFKPRRRTRAQTAREAGLEPLADLLMAQAVARGTADEAARPFVDPAKGIDSAEAALSGARDIVAERISEDPAVRAFLRERVLRTGVLVSRPKRGATGEKVDHFRDYADYREPVRRVPSHRYLAVCRGESEDALSVSVESDEAEARDFLRRRFLKRPSVFTAQVEASVDESYARLLSPVIERDARSWLKERSDQEAVRVFAKNLESLLLEPPGGGRPVLGVDPGLRTGCKVAALDGTGAVRATATIQPFHGDTRTAARIVQDLVTRVRADRIVVGNGTASRETVAFLNDACGLRDKVAVVSEAGASVYSASDLAREELPGLDVTLRGAVSIGRRFQDPLAELVKVPPQAIGVGQYQHDVDEGLLGRSLDGVVEDCVNRVGVEVNTASPALLSRVAGVGPVLARSIVSHRETNGPFRCRSDLGRVPRLGPKTFEQAAGFLRIRDGAEPLDRTGVHPERYELVRRMARRAGLAVQGLLGNAEALKRVRPEDFVDEESGLPTVSDVLAELARPGRDPRGDRQEVAFRDDVRSIDHLSPGMVLAGVVTNVAAFGVFVDVGVHRDGLVHVSRLADRFVRDPAEVCRPGQAIRVKVVEVDKARGRFGLTMKPSEVG